MRKIFITIFLSILFYGLNAQNPEIDSILNVINTSEKDSVKAASLNDLAWKFMYKNPDTTRVIANDAIVLSRKIGDNKLLINAINSYATSYAVQGNLDTSLVYFKNAEKIAREINDDKELAMVQNNIGLVFWNQGKLESAIVTYQAAIKNFKIVDKVKVGWANTYNNLGLIYNDLGDLDSAVFFYKKALIIFDSLKTKSRGVANTNNNIGIIYKEKGNWPNALEYYLKALKIYEEIEDQSDGIANVLSNIGNIYQELKEYDKALSYFYKSKTAFEGFSDQSLGLANTLNYIGVVYRQQGDNIKALESYEKALKMQEAIGEISIGMANSLTNIGTIKESEQKLKEASEYFNRAKLIQEEIGEKKGIAYSLFFLGNLKVLENNMHSGIIECEESLALAKKLGLLDLKMNSCDCLADAYQRLKNTDRAYHYYKLFISYRDSLTNQENTRAITQKAMTFEFEKIQLRDSIQRSEIDARKALEQKAKDIEKEAQIHRQQIYTATGLGGFVLMLGLAFVLFRGYKNKQKANEIITAQKEEVEQQKSAVEEQKEIIEEKNREIVDSISYAKRIQSAILPSYETINDLLPESFIFFQPKDIVSGDFYWLDSKDNKVFFAAVDCTGHGVPGAMVSVVGHNGLNRVLREFQITEPGKMLDQLNEIVEETFESNNTESVKDGMDMAICSYNRESLKLNYAGANNPLYLIREGEIIEYKADKQPIGKYDYRKEFTNHEIQLQKGDSIYIFSDGYADQFGGPKGKKLMYKPFKRLLVEICGISISEQKKRLQTHFNNWKGDLEQIDDVCVLGLKI